MNINPLNIGRGIDFGGIDFGGIYIGGQQEDGKAFGGYAKKGLIFQLDCQKGADIAGNSWATVDGKHSFLPGTTHGSTVANPTLSLAEDGGINVLGTFVIDPYLTIGMDAITVEICAKVKNEITFSSRRTQYPMYEDTFETNITPTNIKGWSFSRPGIDTDIALTGAAQTISIDMMSNTLHIDGIEQQITGTGKTVYRGNNGLVINCPEVETIYSIRIYKNELSQKEIEKNHLADQYRFGDGPVVFDHSFDITFE